MKIRTTFSAIAIFTILTGCTYVYNGETAGQAQDGCQRGFSKVIVPDSDWFFRECYKENAERFINANFQRALMICGTAYAFYRHADIKLLHDIASRIANDRWIVDSYERHGLRECDRGKIYRQLAEKAFFYYFEQREAK